MITVSFRIYLFNQLKTLTFSFNPFDPEQTFWFNWINAPSAKILWYAE